PAPGLAQLRHMRVLVHAAPNSVADQRPDDRQAVGLDALLHGVRHVTETVAGTAARDGLEQGGLRRVEQLAGYRRDLTDGERPRRVGDPPVEDDPYVDGEDVAAL